MATLRRHTAWALAVAGFAVAGAVIAVLLLDGKGSTATAQDPAPPAGLFRLAALKAPPSSAPVPFLGRDSLRESGYDVESGRLLATSPSGSQVIVIPRKDPATGKDELCVVVTDARQPTAGAGTCAAAGDFNAGGMFVTLSRGNPDTDEVVGVLPDGVGAVTVHSADGKDHAVQVDHGVVRFKHADATSATVPGPDGDIEQPIAGGLNE
jgi:hypothetical protein